MSSLLSDDEYLDSLEELIFRLFDSIENARDMPRSTKQKHIRDCKQKMEGVAAAIFTFEEGSLPTNREVKKVLEQFRPRRVAQKR